jgi:K+-sensing histidine kinase KdpD
MSNGRENRDLPEAGAGADSVAQLHLPRSTTLPISLGASSGPDSSSRQGASFPPMPPTFFAPAERVSRESLLESIEQVAQSRVVSALLRSSTSMMCILNEHRQVLALNAAYLDGLKADNADDILGLRPGEAIHCTHSDEHPGGCGTGQHCRSCGAAIAIVAAQRTGKPVQRECLLSARDRKGHTHDYSFLVRASPCVEARENLLVLSLTDVSSQKLHAGLERAFLHDLSNVVGALSATAELLKIATPAEANVLINDLGELTQRLSRELLVQKLLLAEDPAHYRQNWQKVHIKDTLHFIERLFSNHPVASSKRLVVELHLQTNELNSDASLLERVLTNMVTNGFEASDIGQVVKLTATSDESNITFSVWNSAFMDQTVASRVFQRFFTTKKGLGRGQGTYAIKLIGERLLRGKVQLTTSRDAGTTFSLTLPIDSRRAG